MPATICDQITKVISVSDDRDKESDELKRVNEQLRESLAACRFMLADARAKLTANNNEENEEIEPRSEDARSRK
jgi:hypothetical protein